jgi:trk/ktr system potassium uptake protein
MPKSAKVQETGGLAAVLFSVGVLLGILATAMLVPAATDLLSDYSDANAFLISAALTGFTGILLVLGNRRRELRLTRRNAFVLTTVSWLATGICGALPFMLSTLHLSFADAFFETISGLTTTGSTILTGLELMPTGILLWRGLLQWLGGIGIIVMAVSLLPFLQVGGMHLIQTEFSDRSEKVMPRPAQFGRALVTVYVFLSASCALLYWNGGMSGFDAIVHAMSTISTGGYSNYDSSLGHFPQPFIQVTAIVFMVLGGMPFVMYVRMLRGDFYHIWSAGQARTFIMMLAGVITFLVLWLWLKGGIPPLKAIMLVSFQVVSIVTTTGYVTADYEQWVQGTEAIFLVLTIIGGCMGSTAGGIKILRFQIMFAAIRYHLRQLIFPRMALAFSYSARLGDTHIISTVFTFFAVFLASYAGLAIALSLFGLDMVTSLSASATALCNVGPGLGAIIGPAGNFATLPNGAKWLLSFGMLLGRLELFTVFAFLLPLFWRR